MEEMYGTRWKRGEGTAGRWHRIAKGCWKLQHPMLGPWTITHWALPDLSNATIDDHPKK